MENSNLLAYIPTIYIFDLFFLIFYLWKHVVWQYLFLFFPRLIVIFLISFIVYILLLCSFIVFYCVYMLDKVSRLMFDIIYSGFPGDTAVKNPPPNKGDLEAQFDPWVTKIPWRGKWQPTLVFLPGESYKQRGVVDYSPWGCKESDMSQWLSMHVCKDRELKMWLT